MGSGSKLQRCSFTFRRCSSCLVAGPHYLHGCAAPVRGTRFRSCGESKDSTFLFSFLSLRSKVLFFGGPKTHSRSKRGSQIRLSGPNKLTYGKKESSRSGAKIDPKSTNGDRWARRGHVWRYTERQANTCVRFCRSRKD